MVGIFLWELNFEACKKIMHKNQKNYMIGTYILVNPQNFKPMKISSYTIEPIVAKVFNCLMLIRVY